VYAAILALTLSTAAGQLPPDIIFPVEPEFPPLPCECPPSPRRIAAKPQPARDVVLRWNDVVLDAIRVEKTAPPVAARNLAIVHIAMYDAVNTVRGTHRSFHVSVGARRGTSAETAAALAAHRSLLSLYPKQARQFDAALDESLESIPDGWSKTEGVNLGPWVAEKVLDWRRDDMEGTSRYAARTELGRWQPTLPGLKPPLLPHWGTVKPFALRDLADVRPPGPPTWTSEEFEASYREVKILGAVDSRVRTADETEIARFWADGEGTVTPPGHWNRIAQTVATERGLSFEENARLFAMLNVAMADAAIACWECKFHFDVWRPITAIRFANQLKNPAIVANPDWTPLLPTPPFPGYTSGHSSFSGAAAAVLAAFFGSDSMRFASTSDTLPGKSRSFVRFSDAAMEAGMSRIYGGIHWNFDNRDGLEFGKKIGLYVNEHSFQPIDRPRE